MKPRMAKTKVSAEGSSEWTAVEAKTPSWVSVASLVSLTTAVQCRLVTVQKILAVQHVDGGDRSSARRRIYPDGGCGSRSGSGIGARGASRRLLISDRQPPSPPTGFPRNRNDNNVSPLTRILERASTTSAPGSAGALVCIRSMAAAAATAVAEAWRALVACPLTLRGSHQ